jgi:hypothetical protein
LAAEAEAASAVEVESVATEAETAAEAEAASAVESVATEAETAA